MDIRSAQVLLDLSKPSTRGAPGQASDKLQDVAADFLGSGFFRMLIKSMRKTVPESVYFGSLANRVFQDFMDDQLATFMAAESGPLLESTVKALQQASAGDVGGNVDLSA